MDLDTIYEIPLSQIVISDDNVRLHDPDRDIEELAASIAKHGLLQPVVLLGRLGKPPYELISGQRRFLAHKKYLKVKTIRAVFAGPLNKTQAVVRSLVENLQRTDLEYVDAARAITGLYRKFGKDERQVQRETGLPIRRIRDYILIEAQATPRMKKLMKEKKVSTTDVKRCLRAAQNNLRKAEQLLDLIIEYQPTAHQKRRIVQYGQKGKSVPAKQIFEDAMKPHVEESIVISLSEPIRAALVDATKAMSMEPEELASHVLGSWLRSQGFVND
jgi:ParB family chromosome partitioning protein